MVTSQRCHLLQEMCPPHLDPLHQSAPPRPRERLAQWPKRGLQARPQEIATTRKKPTSSTSPTSYVGRNSSRPYPGRLSPRSAMTDPEMHSGPASGMARFPFGRLGETWIRSIALCVGIRRYTEAAGGRLPYQLVVHYGLMSSGHSELDAIQRMSTLRAGVSHNRTQSVNMLLIPRNMWGRPSRTSG